MRILVIGETGQVAQALARQKPGGHEVNFIGRIALDLSWDTKKIDAALAAYPDVDAVINTAAYTDVNGAEHNMDLAFAVNARSVGTIADACANRHIPLIHISTDYVFDGEKREPYKPEDAPNPLNVYGASKLAGEMAIRESGVRGAIVRTSWVYDGYGKNFFTTIMDRVQKTPSFEIVRDQIGRPTHSGILVDALYRLASIDQKKLNIYHISSNGPVVGWDDFARKFLRLGFPDSYQPGWVRSVVTALSPDLAQRPTYSVLDTSAYEHDFPTSLPDWREGVEQAIHEWHSKRAST